MIEFAIYGSGRVGQALSCAIGRDQFPVYSRGSRGRATPRRALVCWPAHALGGLTVAFPELADEAVRIVTFCNGAWAADEAPVDEEGICYVRVREVPTDAWADVPTGRWRVACKDTAAALRRHGLEVTASVDHRPHVWGKALYILPLALACAELGSSAKDAAKTEAWAEWFDVVRARAAAEVCATSLGPQVSRALYLIDRLPRDWRPSCSPDELTYFREKLCAD